MNLFWIGKFVSFTNICINHLFSTNFLYSLLYTSNVKFLPHDHFGRAHLLVTPHSSHHPPNVRVANFLRFITLCVCKSSLSVSFTICGQQFTSSIQHNTDRDKVFQSVGIGLLTDIEEKIAGPRRSA